MLQLQFLDVAIFLLLILMNVVRNMVQMLQRNFFSWIRVQRCIWFFEYCKRLLSLLQICFSYVTDVMFVCYGEATGRPGTSTSVLKLENFSTWYSVWFRYEFHAIPTFEMGRSRLQATRFDVSDLQAYMQIKWGWFHRCFRKFNFLICYLPSLADKTFDDLIWQPVNWHHDTGRDLSVTRRLTYMAMLRSDLDVVNLS